MQKFAETRIVGNNAQRIGNNLDLRSVLPGTTRRILTDVTQPRNSPRRTRIVDTANPIVVRRNPAADVLNTNTGGGTNIGGGGITNR